MIVVDLLSRWIHVGAAIVLMGGAVYMLLAVQPALSGLSDDLRLQLKESLRTRWSRVVMLGVALLLVTGFYNYLAVSVPKYREAANKGLYHGLMGAKILVGLAVFFLASALAGRSAALEGIRRQDKKWLTVLIILAAVVVAIGGALKVAVPPSAAV